MKKIGAVLLAGLMAVSLAGCGSGSGEKEAEHTASVSGTSKGETADSGERVTVGEDEIIQVGFITYSLTDSLNTTCLRAFDMFSEDLGFEVSTELFASVEDIDTCAQNLLQNGCQVIVSITPSIPLLDLCEEYNAYLTIWGNTISDPEMAEYFAKSPYYAGCDSVSDWDAATNAMQTLYDNGCRNLGIITQSTLATNHSIRLNAINDFVENHEDMKIVAQVGCDSNTSDVSAGVQNMIALYGEMDGLIATTVGSGWGDAIVSTLEAEGKAGEIHFAGIDWTEAAADWLDKGYLDDIEAGQFPDLMFNVINACNVARGAYEGNRQLEGRFVSIKGADGYADYIKYFDSEGVYPYSLEQLQSVCFYNNPEATYEELHDLWAGYSFEGIIEYWSSRE